MKKEKAEQLKNEMKYGEYYTIHVKKIEIDEKGNDMIRVVPIQKCVESPLQRIRLVCVDEIGQYIADDTQLMLNLQTIVEDLGTACKGKACVIVTSQEDFDSITKSMGIDFSKIQGRFDT